MDCNSDEDSESISRTQSQHNMAPTLDQYIYHHHPSATSEAHASSQTPSVRPLVPWTHPVYTYDSPAPVMYYPVYVVPPGTPGTPGVVPPTTASALLHTDHQTWTPPPIRPNDRRRVLNGDESEDEEVSGSGRRAKKTDQQKLEDVLSLLRRFRWSIGTLLQHVFLPEFTPSRRHDQFASKFLQGSSSLTPGAVIAAWFKSPYGLPPQSSPERAFQYSTTVDYQSIKHARPAISSFAAQLIGAKLTQEARKGVKRESGLHTFTSGGSEVSRYDLGAEIFSDTTQIFKHHTPLAWYYLLQMALPDEQAISRERRPPEMVSNCIIQGHNKEVLNFGLAIGCNSCSQHNRIFAQSLCKNPCSPERDFEFCVFVEPLHIQVR